MSQDFEIKFAAVSMDEWTIFRVSGDAIDKLAMK